MKYLGKNIRYLRKKKNLSQNELAEMFGYNNYTTIQKWESEKADPPVKIVKGLSEYFGVNIDDLVKSDLEENPSFIKTIENNRESLSLPSDTIPILGVVTAGRPIFADENIIGYTKNDINEDCFGLRIQGDSMIPDIHDGDIVIVRQQPDAENGEVVVAMVNSDDAVCKRLMKYSWGLQLMSDNPAYEPLVFSAEEVEDKPVRILGKVVELRRKY